MKRINIIVIALSFCLFAYAQYTPEGYIEAYTPLALTVEREYGIPASIVLAQACLESGYGNSRAARLRNNHFGIVHGRRRYASVEECYEAYAVLLTTSKRYASLFDTPLSDYKAWAQGVQDCGYATDLRYARKLILIIEKYCL